jgi:hypothetical protein
MSKINLPESVLDRLQQIAKGNISAFEYYDPEKKIEENNEKIKQLQQENLELLERVNYKKEQKELAIEALKQLGY